ncbi:MAG: thioredoxin family protein [Candidatus Omnitrophica bacterium]|nr:thioredoxin family protein [Candidatus Omnitrophota bacterium]
MVATITAAQAASSDGKQGLIALGTAMPAFRLPDVVSGKLVAPEDFADRKALLLIITCRHCPYAQHVKDGIARLGRDYADKRVGIIAISANDPTGYADDAPDRLKDMAVQAGFVFPLVFDETQETAKALTAVATPDFFLFDQQRRLVYRGQFDASRPGNGKPVTGSDVRAAIDALLSDRPVPEPQVPSFGCSIKWKAKSRPVS